MLHSSRQLPRALNTRLWGWLIFGLLGIFSVIMPQTRVQLLLKVSKTRCLQTATTLPLGPSMQLTGASGRFQEILVLLAEKSLWEAI
jgi:hypothetical protein